MVIVEIHNIKYPVPQEFCRPVNSPGNAGASPASPSSRFPGLLTFASGIACLPQNNFWFRNYFIQVFFFSILNSPNYGKYQKIAKLENTELNMTGFDSGIFWYFSCCKLFNKHNSKWRQNKHAVTQKQQYVGKTLKTKLQ